MEQTHPSFGERIAELKKTASMLHDSAQAIALAAEVVMAEAQHMEAAQKRFAERRPVRATQRASR